MSVHSLQTSSEGSLLDPDDTLLDVVDDREQVGFPSWGRSVLLAHEKIVVLITYFRSGNFHENFIFANSAKRHTCELYVVDGVISPFPEDFIFTKLRTGPCSAVGNMSGYRCVSDCRSRGREFDPGPVPYFRGD